MRSRYAAAVLAGALSISPAIAQDDPGFTMSTIAKIPGLRTVVGISPTEDDNQLALDLHPKGSPADAGKVWIDGCDADYLLKPAQMGCFRVIITPAAVQFGSHGSPMRPVEIMIGGTKVGVFSIANNKPRLVVGDFDSQTVVAQIAQLRREFDALRAARGSNREGGR